MEEPELFSDVVVVGAGNAALTAALAACEAGAQVLVLEKASVDERGGNSRFTGGIVRFVYDGLDDIVPLVPDLSEAEIARLDVQPYSAEAYTRDIMRMSEGKADPTLTSVLVQNSYPDAALDAKPGGALRVVPDSGAPGWPHTLSGGRRDPVLEWWPWPDAAAVPHR